MSVSIKSNFTPSIPVDIYPPEPLNEDDDTSLVILILQGVEVDKSEYAAIATALSRQQFWVIVPNCFPVGKNYLCPENISAAKVLSSLDFSRHQALDKALQKGIILLGHSAGGIAAFGALGTHLPIKKILAIVTYGSTVLSNINLASSLPPILMLSGEKDSVVPLKISKAAFEKIPTSTKTFIELAELNHYSINNSEQPNNAPEEKNRSDISNENSVQMISSILNSFVRAVEIEQENWLSFLDNNIVSMIRSHSAM